MQYVLKPGVLGDLLDRRGLNQSDLAETLGVSREAVSKWVSGESIPKPDKLLRIGVVLESSFDDLVRRDPDPVAPQVYYRRKAARKTRDAHLDQATQRGYLLKQLAPLLPGTRLTRPPTLKDPVSDYDYLQQVADAVRSELKLAEKIDFKQLISKFNDLGAVLIPVLWGEKQEHGNALNVYLPDTQTIWVFLNLDTNALHFNFWMAHELGHSLAPDLRDEKGEDFADALAQAVLCPRPAAEKLRAELLDISPAGQRIQRIHAEAARRLIHPLTIRKAIHALDAACERPATPLGDMAGFMAAAKNFERKFETISSELFGRDAPEPGVYVKKCKQFFQTPFFDALAAYCRSREDADSFIHELLGLPLSDAKALAGALRT